MDRPSPCPPPPTPLFLGTLSSHRWSGLTVDPRDPKSSGNSTLDLEKPSQNIASFSSRSWKYLNAPVRPCGFVELQLILITFCTGLQGQQPTYCLNGISVILTAAHDCRCRLFPRLPLLRIQPDRQHRLPHARRRHARDERGMVYNSQHRDGARHVHCRSVGHGTTGAFDRSPAAAVADLL